MDADCWKAWLLIIERLNSRGSRVNRRRHSIDPSDAQEHIRAVEKALLLAIVKLDINPPTAVIVRAGNASRMNCPVDGSLAINNSVLVYV